MGNVVALPLEGEKPAIGKGLKSTSHPVCLGVLASSMSC